MGAGSYFDFEVPITKLEERISELQAFSSRSGIDVSDEVNGLKEAMDSTMKIIYDNLTPWQRIQVPRHPDRPGTRDIIAQIVKDFVELHGDRAIGDDPAIVTGFGWLDGRKVCIVGQEKGKTTEEKVRCRFGCPNPEGYRKAMLKMKLAEKFKIPVVTLVNTPGAYPGIEAEERGQAFVIAESIYLMMGLRVPTISVIIGEGGSGGALAICATDVIGILEFAYLSVISPEGCASILWRDAAKAPEAAEALKITPAELLKRNIVDEIIPEPVGGAHRNPVLTIENIKSFIVRHLDRLSAMTPQALVEMRALKYSRIGFFKEVATSVSSKS